MLRRHDQNLHDQDMFREPEAGAKGWDMNMLTRIVDQRVMAVTQQLRCDPTSKIEDLLDLDKALMDELWRLDFESVRSLRGMYPSMRKFLLRFP